MNERGPDDDELDDPHRPIGRAGEDQPAGTGAGGLRNAITSGEIAPGTHLVETELSATLGISRGTLREAMRQLQQEGLVAAGNSTLVHAWESLAGSIRMSIMFAGADSAITKVSVHRHQNIVDAIAGGDPGLARRVVERHMQEAMTNMSIGLAQNQAAATA